VVQALATWSRFLSFWHRLIMFFILSSEDLIVKVPVAELLWGRRISLWDRVRRYKKHLVPNDTWFGLMYQVCFSPSVT